MSTAKAMKRQFQAIRAEGQREGMVQGRTSGLVDGKAAERALAVAYLEKRIAATVDATAKTALTTVKTDLTAAEHEKVAPPPAPK